MKVVVAVLLEGDELSKIPSLLELLRELKDRKQKDLSRKETIVIPKKRINRILNDTTEVLRHDGNYSESTILSYKNWISSFLKWLYRCGKYDEPTLEDMEEHARRFTRQNRGRIVNLYALSIVVDKLGKQKTIEILEKLKQYLTKNRYLAAYFYTLDLEDVEKYREIGKYRSAIEAAKTVKLLEEEEKSRETEESKSFFRRLAIDEKNVLDGILR